MGTAYLNGWVVVGASKCVTFIANFWPLRTSYSAIKEDTSTTAMVEKCNDREIRDEANFIAIGHTIIPRRQAAKGQDGWTSKKES